MIRLYSKIKIRQCLQRWEIIVIDNYIDTWGKNYSETQVLSDWATKEIARRELPLETSQAINCGHPIQ